MIAPPPTLVYYAVLTQQDAMFKYNMKDSNTCYYRGLDFAANAPLEGNDVER